MNDEYLWDRSGERDPDVAALETLLARFRMRPSQAPTLPGRRTRIWWYAAVGLAAAVLLAVLAASLLRPSAGWTLTGAEGAKQVALGQTVRTSAGSTARLVSRAVGTVDLAQNTILTVTEVRAGRSELALALGTIHAKTMSPPGVFVVETPHATATDLGCEYTLSVEPGGEGRLHVDAGWVGLRRSARQSLVPEHASAVFDGEGRLTPPVFDDAPAGLFEAVRVFAIDPAPARREAALSTVLALARRRDALTVLNLFPISTHEERLRVYDRLNELVPAPAPVSREAVEDWRTGATDPWWAPVFEASGVRSIKKGKKPLSSAR